jgi:hypothetical protein
MTQSDVLSGVCVLFDGRSGALPHGRRKCQKGRQAEKKDYSHIDTPKALADFSSRPER